MSGSDDDKILPEQRAGLVLTLKLALGEVRPFRPPPGSPDRDVWGKLSEERRKEIADGLVQRMADGNWYIRRGAPAEPHYTGRGHRVQTQDSTGEDDALVRLFSRLSIDEIVQAFEVTERSEILGGNFPPAYNIGAGALLPVIRFNPATGRRHLDLIRWGLVPTSATNETVGARNLAAAAETLADENVFRAAFSRRRCIIVVEGFFAWQFRASSHEPFAVVRADGAPLALPGLWEAWRPNRDAEWIRTCAIVTTSSFRSRPMMGIHPRMPAILRPGDYKRWLSEIPTSSGQAGEMVRQGAPDDLLVAWEVSRLVEDRDADLPGCIEPVDEADRAKIPKRNL